MLRHAECADLLLAKDGLHLGVRGEVLLVLRVLKYIRFKICSSKKHFNIIVVMTTFCEG